MSKTAPEQTATHTPGPWRPFSTAGDGTYNRYPDAGLSTDVYPVASDKYEDRIAGGVHLSNVNLIAAAPDLLQAAKDTLEYWETTGFAECDDGCDCIVDDMRAAIKKAEGR